MSKITRKPMVMLFLILVTLVFSQNAYGSSSLSISVTTDKESYDVLEEILVTGELTQDGAPISDGLVAIQVDDPENDLFVIRTRPTEAGPIGPWSVEILEVITCDQGGNPKDSFEPGGYVGFNVTTRNNDLLAHTIIVTLNVYDCRSAPFEAFTIYSGSIDASETITVTNWGVPIPSNAPDGDAIVYANVFTQLPKDGGFAYSPEKSATFTISNTESLAASTTQTMYSASEEGTYNLTFRIADGYGAKLGTHTVYVCSFYNIWVATNSTTFELVLIGDITGPGGVPDGVVDVDDAQFVAMRFGSYPGHDEGWGWDPRADITGPEGIPDGLIDVDDAQFVGLRFGMYL